MIKINKQLQRPDGGTVSSGSIIDYNSKFIGKTKQVVYFLKHYFSESAIENGKRAIPAITNFAYRQVKECSDAEWIELNMGPDPSGVLVQLWLQEIIDSKIGEGFTEIII